MAKTKESLNPCFCGIYSQRIPSNPMISLVESLNPCFCGIYSQSVIKLNNMETKTLSLNPCFC